MEPMWTNVAITLKSGERLVGVVQGAGGYIRDLPRRTALEYVRFLIDRANEGESLPVYEPLPGHIKLHLGMTVNGPFRSVHIDIRGAQVSAP